MANSMHQVYAVQEQDHAGVARSKKNISGPPDSDRAGVHEGPQVNKQLGGRLSLRIWRPETYEAGAHDAGDGLCLGSARLLPAMPRRAGAAAPDACRSGLQHARVRLQPQLAQQLRVCGHMPSACHLWYEWGMGGEAQGAPCHGEEGGRLLSTLHALGELCHDNSMGVQQAESTASSLRCSQVLSCFNDQSTVWSKWSFLSASSLLL